MGIERWRGGTRSPRGGPRKYLLLRIASALFVGLVVISSSPSVMAAGPAYTMTAQQRTASRLWYYRYGRGALAELDLDMEAINGDFSASNYTGLVTDGTNLHSQALKVQAGPPIPLGPAEEHWSAYLGYQAKYGFDVATSNFADAETRLDLMAAQLKFLGAFFTQIGVPSTSSPSSQSAPADAVFGNMHALETVKSICIAWYEMVPNGDPSLSVLTLDNAQKVLNLAQKVLALGTGHSRRLATPAAPR